MVKLFSLVDSGECDSAYLLSLFPAPSSRFLGSHRQQHLLLWTGIVQMGSICQGLWWSFPRHYCCVRRRWYIETPEWQSDKCWPGPEPETGWEMNHCCWSHNTTMMRFTRTITPDSTSTLSPALQSLTDGGSTRSIISLSWQRIGITSLKRLSLDCRKAHYHQS